MLLLLFPTKIIPPPYSQGLSRGFAVYDTSAVLECKDSDNYWNKEEITDIFLKYLQCVRYQVRDIFKKIYLEKCCHIHVSPVSYEKFSKYLDIYAVFVLKT
jgi:hypothetical protein